LQPSRFSFRQVYFNTSKHGQAAQSEAESLLSKLKKGEEDSKASGDPIMISHQFDLMRKTEIERILGAQFVQALGEMPIGSWQGPIESGFGLHLVFIDEFVAGKVPGLDDVRERVVRDWSVENREKTNRAIYEKERQRYHIVVEEYAGNDNAKMSTARLSKSAVSK